MPEFWLVILDVMKALQKAQLKFYPFEKVVINFGEWETANATDELAVHLFYRLLFRLIVMVMRIFTYQESVWITLPYNFHLCLEE